jgi:hypothetical protein
MPVPPFLFGYRFIVPDYNKWRRRSQEKRTPLCQAEKQSLSLVPKSHQSPLKQLILPGLTNTAFRVINKSVFPFQGQAKQHTNANRKAWSGT